MKQISNKGAPRGWRSCGPREPGAVICMTQGGRKTPRRICYIRQLTQFELATAGRFIGPAVYNPQPAMPPRYGDHQTFF